jgi:hypothetical protein
MHSRGQNAKERRSQGSGGHIIVGPGQTPCQVYGLSYSAALTGELLVFKSLVIMQRNYLREDQAK